ncbi:MAG: hypothetical protein AABX08_00025 [Nanoarchaeota archaeon]
MKIIILFLLIGILLLNACTEIIYKDQPYFEDYIKNEIDKANYCNTKSDCVNIGNQCPFGCYIYVNKDQAERISGLIDDYINAQEARCEYGCLPCNDVICKNNKCEAVCEII